MCQNWNQDLFLLAKSNGYLSPQRRPHKFTSNKLTFFLLWRYDPTRVTASSFTRFLDYTWRHTTVGRTPLDEWSARRRDLYLTTHDTHNRQISMPLVGFKPTISAGEWPAAADRSRDCSAPARTHAHTHTYICMCVYIYTHIYIYIYVCVCACVLVHYSHENGKLKISSPCENQDGSCGSGGTVPFILNLNTRRK